MPTFDAQRKAAELQRQLATLTGHDAGPGQALRQASADPDASRRTSVDTIARLTELGRNSYSAAFRSHTGRWEPLPGTGDLATVADLVVTLLDPYFDPNT